MAEKGNITDFDDYAKPFDFKFQGQVYRIPAMDKITIEALMALNQKMRDEKLEKTAQEMLKEDENSDDGISKDDLDNTKKFFDLQDEYIALAVKLLQEDGSIKDLQKEHFINWAVKVKNKVMSCITEQMSLADEDEVPKKS